MTADGPMALELEDVCFSYPSVSDDGGRDAGSVTASAGAPVLRHASLAIPQGAFCLLSGPTGSGKTTLLRLAKPEIAPAGSRSGEIRVMGRPVEDLASDSRLSAESVGYVFQSPDNQIVCDTVWREMALGLENLGVPSDEMRRRVAETCAFFGIDRWFRKKTAELSGGQRQVLALAATLVMRPRLLLLDEPTSMLDPVAARNFLGLLFRVNRELGTTIVVATHAPAVMADYATMALAMGKGEAAGSVAPRPLGDLYEGQPLLEGDARDWRHPGGAPAIRLHDAWFRYGRDDDWVLRGCDFDVAPGEMRAILGSNGSGKSTLLGMVAGIVKPQAGSIRVAGDLARSQAILPQNPKALLSCGSVGEELMEWSAAGGYGHDEARAMLSGLGISGSDADAERLWRQHPYDLSGGQQQLVALAKLLLVRPRLLLLDEPTKGLDHDARSAMAQALAAARDAGTTILVSTHDLAFCKEVCDTASLLFDGGCVVTQPVGEFFKDGWFWRA